MAALDGEFEFDFSGFDAADPYNDPAACVGCAE